MKLADWLYRIEKIHPKSWDLGLERVAEVADRLDLRKPAPLTFLVAGTNGKGSACACIANLCTALGLRTGVTTSPHLLRFNERIVVDGRQVADESLCEAFRIIDTARGNITLTYFEFAALAALLLFRRAAVDAAVLEVGLGGRLDAMNLVDPDVSVITRIALDHQDWLGETREVIAAEKAGVMRPGKPCVVADADVPCTLHARAGEIGSRLLVAGTDFGFTDGETLRLREGRKFISFPDLPRAVLPRQSAAAAIQAVFCAGLVPDPNQIADVLSDTTLPGRFQIIPGNRTTVMDVAHNPDAAGWLLLQLESLSFERCHAVAGMYRDKDFATVIDMMSQVVDAWYFADLPDRRAARAADLAASLSDDSGCEIRTYGKVCAAYEDAVRRSNRGDLILVFGSFPVVGDVLDFLQMPV